MRPKFLLSVVLVCFCLSLHSGVHVKGNLHFDSFYDSGVLQPEEDVVYEWWFEEDKVSFLTDRWRFTLDKAQARLIAIHRLEKFYVVMPLPLSIGSHVDRQLLENLQQYRIEGKVKKAGRQKIVLGRHCDEYAVSESITFQGGRFYDRERTLAASPKVPFDWKLLDELYGWLRSFFQPSESYKQELGKVTGFMMACEDIRFQEGAEVKYGFRVLEIQEKDAPASVFEIPGDFKEKKTLTRPELIDIRTAYYFYYR